MIAGMARQIRRADNRFRAPAAALCDERNLDGIGDQCYGFAAAVSCGSANFMSSSKAARKKQSLWQTLREASGPYRRLYSYIKPYKVRFIVGLLLGFAYGGVTSLLPLAVGRVANMTFRGAAPSPSAAAVRRPPLIKSRRVTSSIMMLCCDQWMCHRPRRERARCVRVTMTLAHGLK